MAEHFSIHLPDAYLFFEWWTKPETFHISNQQLKEFYFKLYRVVCFFFFLMEDLIIFQAAFSGKKLQFFRLWFYKKQAKLEKSTSLETEITHSGYWNYFLTYCLLVVVYISKRRKVN